MFHLSTHVSNILLSTDKNIWNYVKQMLIIPIYDSYFPFTFYTNFTSTNSKNIALFNYIIICHI